MLYYLCFCQVVSIANIIKRLLTAQNDHLFCTMNVTSNSLIFVVKCCDCVFVSILSKGDSEKGQCTCKPKLPYLPMKEINTFVIVMGSQYKNVSLTGIVSDAFDQIHISELYYFVVR